ncbi:hypothetical protein GCM10010532_063090 [Dactylosporangium siamense]|uniref:Secreted protein n=1 Tax=Dactylosporangium siamense TaxID=685454 RepID=A0A919PV77_9ACTN|nr:hypothetical protein Dsi01nite_088950 [Dactylosporangium siamense]
MQVWVLASSWLAVGPAASAGVAVVSAYAAVATRDTATDARAMRGLRMGAPDKVGGYRIGNLTNRCLSMPIGGLVSGKP